MSQNQSAFQALGEAILEEVVVRAGLDQPHAPRVNDLAVSLDFSVSADTQTSSLMIRCERIGSSPLEIRLDLGSALGALNPA